MKQNFMLWADIVEADRIAGLRQAPEASQVEAAACASGDLLWRYCVENAATSLTISSMALCTSAAVMGAVPFATVLP